MKEAGVLEGTVKFTIYTKI